MASIPEAAESFRARVKGHYRFIDKPTSPAVTPQNILALYRERTLRRLQDGTDLNFAELPGFTGIWWTAKRVAGAEARRGQVVPFIPGKHSGRISFPSDGSRLGAALGLAA